MPKEYELRMGTNTKIPLNGGICLNEETSIELNQSPHNGLLNMCLDNGGILTKRKGQEYIFDDPLIGNGGVTGMTIYKEKIYFICSGVPYAYDKSVNTKMTLPYDGGSFSSNKSTFFNYNGKLYLIDGSKFVYLDETENELKDVVPYIPQISINRKPDGSDSTVNESWNMLGLGFKDSFNGDGTSTEYTLSLKDLLTTAIIATVNGVTYEEGSGINVNRTTGKVTFDVAPAEGTNNVVITAYKEFNLRNNILKCNRAIEFSNRMFFTGNPDLKNYYFAAGISSNNDASYFPQKYMYAIKGSDKAVTGFKVHQNKLVVFKEDLTCTVEATTGLDNTASFPISFLNTEVGCDMPDTIQLINNDIVFCNSYGGVYLVASTIIPGEKSIKPISINVNGDSNRNGILQHTIADLESASSVDHNFKYWLCVGNKAYVLDYREGIITTNPDKNKWFYYDNINASCFVIKDNELIYGVRDYGQLVQFTQAFNDFGLPINAKWRSKRMDFSYPDYLKTISDIWVTFNNSLSEDSVITVKFMSENGNIEDVIVIPANDSWSWSSFSWEGFNWKVRLFDKTIKNRVKIRKICYFQIEFSNNMLDQNLSIKNFVINYKLIRKVR